MVHTGVRSFVNTTTAVRFPRFQRIAVCHRLVDDRSPPNTATSAARAIHFADLVAVIQISDRLLGVPWRQHQHSVVFLPFRQSNAFRTQLATNL